MESERLSYAAVLVSQGTHRFYTLTMPSDVLGRTCFVTTRVEDPMQGFQRVLDQKRAEEIARYIDQGLGTIPSSIVLSAQTEAELTYTRKTKTIEFRDTNRAFMILDGQHRVFGFALANSSLRVPVVIYTALSRQDESRIFIDINTKQKPVPNELLLDIRKLADYESDKERQLSKLFDAFHTDPASPLKGLMSPTERKEGKISRVTFNTAVAPIVPLLSSQSTDEAYSSISAYVAAHVHCQRAVSKGGVPAITKPTLFKAVMKVFPLVAQRVQDRHGPSYTVDNFLGILKPAYQKIQAGKLSNPGKSLQPVVDAFTRALQSGFSL